MATVYKITNFCEDGVIESIINVDKCAGERMVLEHGRNGKPACLVLYDDILDCVHHILVNEPLLKTDIDLSEDIPNASSADIWVINNNGKIEIKRKPIK